MSLPHFPLFSSPSSPSSESFDTPPLSPTNNTDEGVDFFSPPTPNPRRPSLRALARFGKRDSIEPLQYTTPPSITEADAGRRPSLPLVLPELDFQARRMARSVSAPGKDNSSGKASRPFMSIEEMEAADAFRKHCTRLSAFHGLDEYLTDGDDDDDFNEEDEVASQTSVEDTSTVDFADIFSWKSRSTSRSPMSTPRTSGSSARYTSVSPPRDV